MGACLVFAYCLFWALLSHCSKTGTRPPYSRATSCVLAEVCRINRQLGSMITRRVHACSGSNGTSGKLPGVSLDRTRHGWAVPHNTLPGR
ncbi:hypothetical protein EDC04DRAFT_2756342 [Pisolithus marmoratus]|nr:hypothetical protein EDC04DRAFT_2756342 [Pisolithus marmoratus]